MPRGIPKKGFRNMNKNNKNKRNLDLVIEGPKSVSYESDEQIDQKLKDRFEILEMISNYILKTLLTCVVFLSIIKWCLFFNLRG